MHHIVVGIDPGSCTGHAELNTHTGKLEEVKSLAIHQSLERVKELHEWGWLSHVVYEDAHLRKWFGNAKRGSPEDIARRQGAGSVKRDCSIWADFLGMNNIPFKTVSPQGKGAKLDAKAFRAMTGWTPQTNEHSRDAGTLIWGARALQRIEDLE